MMVTFQQGPLKPFLRTPRCLGYNLSMRTWQIKADGGVFHNKQTGKLIQGLKWKGGFQREGVCGEIYHFIMDYSCLLEDARFHCCDAKVWFISKLCMRPWTVHKASDYEEKAVWGMTNWMLYHLEVTVISFFLSLDRSVCNMFTSSKPRMQENTNPPSRAHLHASYLYVNMHLCYWKQQQGSEGGQRRICLNEGDAYMHAFVSPAKVTWKGYDPFVPLWLWQSAEKNDDSFELNSTYSGAFHSFKNSQLNIQ